MNAEAKVLLDHNSHALIVFREGRKTMYAVALHNPPVRIIKLPLEERRYFRPMMLGTIPYPARRAVRLFRRAGRTFGITKAARTVLQALA